MRRALTIAAFFILSALVSASAKHGGMRASGGGRRVAVGHASGGHVFGGMHAGLRTGMGARSSPSFHTPSFRRDGFDRGRFGGHRFHHCFGCRRGFVNPWFAGFGYAGYYDPWWWDSSSYNYDEDRDRELALANEMNSVNLEEQRLREQEDRDRDSYARRSQPREKERAAVGPATALVFRDQHVEEVRNYAIAGGTLWVLNEQAAKKIPLTQLDLVATAKMNDDRGVDFQVPK
jgi:hypothetical protein